jgi:hypothetical protein
MAVYAVISLSKTPYIYIYIHGSGRPYPVVMAVWNASFESSNTHAFQARFWTEIYDGAKLFYLSGLQHGRCLVLFHNGQGRPKPYLRTIYTTGIPCYLNHTQLYIITTFVCMVLANPNDVVFPL